MHEMYVRLVNLMRPLKPLSFNIKLEMENTLGNGFFIAFHHYRII